MEIMTINHQEVTMMTILMSRVPISNRMNLVVQKAIRTQGLQIETFKEKVRILVRFRDQLLLVKVRSELLQVKGTLKALVEITQSKLLQRNSKARAPQIVTQAKAQTRIRTSVDHQLETNSEEHLQVNTKVLALLVAKEILDRFASLSHRALLVLKIYKRIQYQNIRLRAPLEIVSLRVQSKTLEMKP